MLQEALISQLRGTESGANDIKEEYVTCKKFQAILILDQNRVWK